VLRFVGHPGELDAALPRDRSHNAPAAPARMEGGCAAPSSCRLGLASPLPGSGEADEAPVPDSPCTGPSRL
jgi:hypothetical protein